MGAKAGADAVADEVDAGKGMCDRSQRLECALAPDAGEANSRPDPGDLRRPETRLLDRRAKRFGNGGPGRVDAEPRCCRARQALPQRRSRFVFDAGAAAGSAAVDTEEIMRRRRGGTHPLIRSIWAPHRRSLRSSCS
jgi:hypothetical protein